MQLLADFSAYLLSLVDDKDRLSNYFVDDNNSHARNISI